MDEDAPTPTEVWFRNPKLYIRELVELNVANVVWDRGFLVKSRIDPLRHAELYFPASTDFRLLLAGEQGTAELRRGHDLANPFAVYPTWEYGAEDLPVLEEMLAYPVGQNAEACADPAVPVDERPIFGQEHRVVITRAPAANTGPGRQFFGVLAELQEEYPEAIIHVHGLYSYRVAFGMGFRSADTEARTLAAKGKVTLPNGKEIEWEKTERIQQWVTMLGFKCSDLAEPRNRCLYNIKSAIWAGENFRRNVRFLARRTRSEVDADSPTALAITTPANIEGSRVKVQPGDKLICDACSLADTCKYYRAGAACSLPNSEGQKLVSMFGARDSDRIIEGLGKLMAIQEERLAKGLAWEDDDGELNPEVTKILASMFGNGVKLAKLVNPALAAAGAPKVAVQINQGEAPKQVSVAQAIAAIEARGVRREDITEEMVQRELSPGAPIEATAEEDDGSVAD